MECHKVKKVEYLKDYKLKLKFNDRKTKIVDLWPRIKNAKGIMKPLKNIEYFKQVSCDGITVLWPNGVDLCPDSLYMMGKGIEETTKKPF